MLLGSGEISTLSKVPYRDCCEEGSEGLCDCSTTGMYDSSRIAIISVTERLVIGYRLAVLNLSVWVLRTHEES